MTRMPAKTPDSLPAEEPQSPESPPPKKLDLATAKLSVVDWGRRSDREPWVHASAAKLHGWAEHCHHEHGGAKHMELLRKDYDAACATVLQPPPYEPHPAALSEHAPIAKRKSAKKEV